MFDIIGAWLVAWEIINKYREDKFTSPRLTMGDMTNSSPFPSAEESSHYKNYELRKYRKMGWGLACLTIGFIFQIVPNFLQIIHP
ncbi:MAG: hypothetical protein ABFD50_14475 [Smithella sp.]